MITHEFLNLVFYCLILKPYVLLKLYNPCIVGFHKQQACVGLNKVMIYINRRNSRKMFRKRKKFLKGLAFESDNVSVVGISPNPRSLGSISPGDVLFFSYEDEMYLVLVLSTTKGRTSFVSTRKNLLLTCFKLDLNKGVHIILLKKLYKNMKSSHYSLIKNSLFKTFGVRYFRSFIFPKMSDIYELTLDIK